MVLMKIRVETEKVLAAFARRERERWGVAAGQLALGLVMTVLLPLVMGGFWAMGVAWRVGAGGTGGMAVVVLLALMAIAYVVEWRTRGEWLEGQLRDFAGGGGALDWGTGRMWRYERASGAVMLEMYLWVPRMVFEGAGRLRARARVRGADRARAAEVLGELLSRGRGEAVEALQQTGERAAGFGRVLGYLVLYEWVGVSEDGGRVWASSEGREEIGVGGRRG
jgi:hypothetical protein